MITSRVAPMVCQNRFRAITEFATVIRTMSDRYDCPGNNGLRLIRSAGRKWKWQLRNQRGAEYLNRFYVLAPTALRATICGTEYLETTDPVTEVWHFGQRFSIAIDGARSISYCWLTFSPVFGRLRKELVGRTANALRTWRASLPNARVDQGIYEGRSRPFDALFRIHFYSCRSKFFKYTRHPRH